MLEITIPGGERFMINHIVIDYNGTLAVDGILIEGIQEYLEILAHNFNVHILSADTHNNVHKQLKDFPVEVIILKEKNQDIEKLNYVKKIGGSSTICIGNGRNDRLMLKEAAIGIVVIEEEGAALDTILNADIIVRNITSAFGLIMNPLRIKATLRNR